VWNKKILISNVSTFILKFKQNLAQQILGITRPETALRVCIRICTNLAPIHKNAVFGLVTPITTYFQG
jgi:hypothetical protein